ncbi:MAG: hypothetical protein ACJ76F_04430 [Bacteroidia bacterium]
MPDFQSLNFTEKENPMNLKDIEAQIHRSRTDLLKEKNKLAKIEYQLYFLFEYGSSKDFIALYEENSDKLFLTAQIRAAVVYSTIHQTEKARNALKLYFKSAINYRPFDPFLCKSLLPLLDNTFIKTLNIKP